MKVNLKVFGDSSARLTAIRKLVGMQSKIKQATTHKAPEIFLELIVVFFSGDVLRSRSDLRTMINNFKLTNTNGGRHRPMNISKNSVADIPKAFLPTRNVTFFTVKNTAMRASSLPLVTDAR